MIFKKGIQCSDKCKKHVTSDIASACKTVFLSAYIRPDIFNFSSFKNPDRIFQEMEKNNLNLDVFIADRIKIVPNL